MASTGTTPNLARSRPPVGGRDRHGGAAGPHLATYRYVGSLGYYQTGSSLMHLGARYYMPEVGRFMQIDPAIRNRAMQPHAPIITPFAGHPYVYCTVNPLRRVDPSGFHMVPHPYGWGMYWHGACMGKPLHTHPNGDSREQSCAHDPRQDICEGLARAAWCSLLCGTLCLAVAEGCPVYLVCYTACRAACMALR